MNGLSMIVCFVSTYFNFCTYFLCSTMSVWFKMRISLQDPPNIQDIWLKTVMYYLVDKPYNFV